MLFVSFLLAVVLFVWLKGCVRHRLFVSTLSSYTSSTFSATKGM